MNRACNRCGSRTMARTYDPDGRGTLLVCVACGHEDFSTYFPVRLLPKFASHTGQVLEGYFEARCRQAAALFSDGLDAAQVAARLGVGRRTIDRYAQLLRSRVRELREVAS